MPAYAQNASVAANALQERPASHVQSQMSRASSLTEELKNTVSQLEMRLGDVLREKTNMKEQAGLTPPPRPLLVGHANALSNHNDQLADLLEELGSILNRIEL